MLYPLSIPPQYHVSKVVIGYIVDTLPIYSRFYHAAASLSPSCPIHSCPGRSCLGLELLYLALLPLARHQCQGHDTRHVHLGAKDLGV